MGCRRAATLEAAPATPTPLATKTLTSAGVRAGGKVVDVGATACITGVVDALVLLAANEGELSSSCNKMMKRTTAIASNNTARLVFDDLDSVPSAYPLIWLTIKIPLRTARPNDSPKTPP